MSYASVSSSVSSAASRGIKGFGTVNYLSEVSAVSIAVFLFVTGLIGKEQKNRIAVYKGATVADKDKKANMAATVNTLNDVTTYVGVAALVAMAFFFFGKMKKKEGGGVRLGSNLNALSHVQLAAFFIVFAWLVFILAENLAVYNDVAVWKKSDKGCPAAGVTAPVASDPDAAKEAASYYNTYIAFLTISILFAVLVILSRTMAKKASAGSSVASASSTGIEGGVFGRMGSMGSMGYYGQKSSAAPSALEHYGAKYGSVY